MSTSLRALFRAGAGAVLVAALLPGCGIFRELGVGGDDPQWLERKYEGVSSSTVLQLAETVIRDRYPPGALDLYRGTLDTGWIYGRYAQVTHQALRQRVRVETEVDGKSVLVRLRVQQETSESAGRVVEDDPGDWEPCDDDAQEAKLLLTRLNILMKEIVDEAPEPAPKK
jgi:hypothetical protein